MGRREFLLGSAALVAAGCSAGERPQRTGPTRAIDTHMGQVRIPVQPRRVVCLDQYSTLAMLDVGQQPVGTINDLDDWMPVDRLPAYRKLPRVGGYEADPERIIKLRPDLIIGNSAFSLKDNSAYKTLSSIAPTVILPAASAGEWQRMALSVADAVNQRAAMDKLRTRYVNRAAEIRQRHASALTDLRFSLVAAFERGQWNLCLPDSWSGVVLAEAGFQFASASAGKTGNAVEQSYEQLGSLADSDIVLYQVNPDGKVDPAMQDLLDQPTFQALPPVHAGNAVPMRGFYVFCYSQALGALDELEAVLTR